MSVSEDLLRYIEKSPTSYQAVEEAAALLSQEDFLELQESENWEICYGGSYFVRRNDSSLIAFSIPEEFQAAHICASHADSPLLKIKEIARKDIVKAMLIMYALVVIDYTFGRILGKSDTVLFNLCFITAYAGLIAGFGITNNNGSRLSMQGDMLPLYSLEGAGGDLLSLIAENAGVLKEEILGSDLFAVNHQKGCIWGPDGEFISAPRIDDLQCAYAALRGFLSGERKEHLSVYALFDNEEIGSRTLQGAESTFLQDVLRRIYLCLGRDFQRWQMDLARSFMISADNAHAVHPNYPEKADPVNQPVIGGGVVLKFSGMQKYCTDARSAALFRQLAKEAGCSVQVYTNHSDNPGGSTLGNLSLEHVSISTADIGLPQLAMHSPYETAGTKDTEDLARIMKVFYH